MALAVTVCVSFLTGICEFVVFVAFWKLSQVSDNDVLCAVGHWGVMEGLGKEGTGWV